MVRWTCLYIIAAGLLHAGCVSLTTHQLSVRMAPKRPAPCVFVEVPNTHAVHVVVDQAIDIKLSKTTTPNEVFDGFDFGEEAVPLIEPGVYRIEILPVQPVVQTHVLNMSQHAIPLQQSQQFLEAARWATVSKNSGRREDLDTSLRLWQQLGHGKREAQTYLKLGDRHLAGGDSVQARTAYEAARAICAELAWTRCVAEAANNSGLAALNVGELEFSRQRLTAAQNAWRTEKDAMNEGFTLSNLGLLSLQAGDFRAAISYYDQSRKLLYSNRLAVARALNNLGLCYLSLAEFAKAKTHFQIARRIFQATRSNNDAVRARINLGRALYLSGSLEAAQTTLVTAITEATRLKDRSALADAQVNLGQLLIKRKEFASAKNLLEQSLGAYESNSDRRGQASALHHLALVARAESNPTAARTFFDRAIELRSSTGLRSDMVDSLAAVSELEFDAGHLKEAQDLAGQAIDLAELVRQRVPGAELRAAYYARQRRLLELSVDIAMAGAGADRVRAGLVAVERGRGRAVVDQLADSRLLSVGSPELQSRLEAVQRQFQLLSYRLSRAMPPQSEALRQQIDLTLAEEQGIRSQIEESIRKDRYLPSSFSAEQIIASVPEGSALLEFHLGSRKSYLWLVTRNVIETFDLPEKETIERVSERVIRLLQDYLARRRDPARQAEFERSLRQLSTLLFGSLANHPLPAKLILVPDGVLHRAPLAALFTAGRKRLGLEHDLLQVPAASLLVVGRVPAPISSYPKTIFALTDPAFSPDDPRITTGGNPQPVSLNLPRLPFSAEIDEVEKLVPAQRRQILRGLDASVTNLERHALNEFAVLHFSTHAIIDERTPEVSRIFLSMVDLAGRPVDGLIRPGQFAQYHLNGPLVILAACETAAGKQVAGEGIAGFSNSLFYAGASQLLLTLISVDAEATSELLKEFFNRTLGPSAQGIEAALRMARRALVDSGRWSDPYFWSAFVLSGRPGPKW